MCQRLQWIITSATTVFMFLSEIPGFLSEEECRVVVQLAQLKGLMDSQATASSQEQEESNQPLLSLSTEEVFSLLDLNQDGLLQKQEVMREKHYVSAVAGGKLISRKSHFLCNVKLDELSEHVLLSAEIRKTLWSFL